MDPFCKLKNVKTLLVDDNELVRDSLKLVFKLNDCTLQTVETAEKGLKAIENEHFDIIISDFNLPKMNGIEFFKLLNRDHPNSLKVLISACIDAKIESNALANGAHKFIEKPFSAKTLVESLSFLIETEEQKV